MTKLKAMKKEADVKENIKRILHDLGVYYFMPAMNGFGRAGIPDFVCCMRGTFVGIEAKYGSNKTTPAQDMEIKRIRDTGGVAFVVNDETVHNLESLLMAHIGLEV